MNEFGTFTYIVMYNMQFFYQGTTCIYNSIDTLKDVFCFFFFLTKKGTVDKIESNIRAYKLDNVIFLIHILMTNLL